jgi:hypothetical protein
MANFNKFHAFVESLSEGIHDLGADNLKVYLSNVAPNASTHLTYDGTTGSTAPAEIAAGNGYTAGGNTAAVVSSVQTSGVYKLTLSDPDLWTATGGAIGPFRYFVLWNSTAATRNLIGWWDFGSSLTLNATESFLVDLNQTDGVLTLT